MDDLARFDKNRKYLFIDAETECLNLFENKPWEIGITLVQDKKILEERVVYTNWPDLKVTKIAAMITKFYEKEHLVKRGLNPEQTCDILDKYLKDPTIYPVGSNLLGFDSHVFNYVRRYCGRPIDYSFINRTYDTHLLTKAYIKNFDPPIYQKDNIYWQMKVSNDPDRSRTGIKAGCKLFGVEYLEDYHHDAIQDNRMTWSIFDKILYNIEIR